jgi:hypothetical protein
MKATRKPQIPSWKEMLKMSGGELSELGERLSKAPAQISPPGLDRRLDQTILKLRKQRGRPRIGEGSKSVLISLEKGLLDKADRFAKTKKISRSELIAKALRDVLSKAG